MKWYRVFPWLLCVFLGVCLYFSHTRENKPSEKEIIRIDSIVHDTVTIIKPEPKYVEVVRYDTIEIEKINMIHSPHVEIPIESKEYQYSTYHAWISGYKASLDSINVYPTTIYRTKVIKQIDNKRFGLGIHAGYGLNGAYVGVGVSYNILMW